MKKELARSAIVVGGGIVGLSCAIELQRRGVETLLVDPARPRPASWGNAGHIAIEQVEPLASRATLRSAHRRLFLVGGALSLPPRDIAAWLPFALRMVAATSPSRFQRGGAALAGVMREAMPAWRRLVSAAGADDLLREDGHFVVWENEASAAKARRSWAGADTGTATHREASSGELAAIRALVSAPIAGGIRFSGSGQISDPGLLAETLSGRFEALGGRREQTAATRLPADGTGIAVEVEDGRLLRADAVVCAAGLASGGLLSPLGHKVPIIAERGYHIQSAVSDWPMDMPPVVFEDRSMIVTRFRSGLRAASFVEFGRAESPPDERKWKRLRGHVAALGLPFALPGKPWMGARPTLPDYLPAIGHSRRAANLYYAFGHQHLGLTLGPATGEAVGALVCGDAPGFDLMPFDIDRFGGKQP